MSGTGGTHDLNIQADGTLLIGQRGGQLGGKFYRSNTDFSEVVEFDRLGNENVFVAFASSAIPEPGSLVLFASGLIACTLTRRR